MPRLFSPYKQGLSQRGTGRGQSSDNQKLTNKGMVTRHVNSVFKNDNHEEEHYDSFIDSSILSF